VRDPANEHREPALGAPRIHGESLTLGFEVAQSSVAKYEAIGGRNGLPTNPENNYHPRQFGFIADN
jgi:hypothetical protein